MQRLWFERVLLPDGWAERVAITLADGLIARIDRGADPAAQDERHAVAVPGLSNVHSHAFQRGMAGLTEFRGPGEDTFWTWRRIMYRFVDRMTPDDVEALATMLYVEMLEAGFTRVGEFHYLHHDSDGRPYAEIGTMAQRIAAAAAGSGIGLTLLPAFYAHGNFGGAPAAPGQRRFLCDVDLYARLVEATRDAVATLPDAVVGIAPHSLRAATVAEIAAILPLAMDGPVHIHIAEQVKEVEDGMAWCGCRPVAYLLDSLPVDRRWCLIHATHVDAAECEGLAASGAVAGLCPITEANLGDGIFPAAAYLAAGGRFGVGSDSNVAISAAGELRQLEYGQRLTKRARNVLTEQEGQANGRRLFDAAVSGGAAALGQARAGLSVGAAADIVGLDAMHVCLAARSDDALLNGWIFSNDATMIDCVWRRGVKLVENGRHRMHTEAANRCRTSLGRILT